MVKRARLRRGRSSRRKRRGWPRLLGRRRTRALGPVAASEATFDADDEFAKCLEDAWAEFDAAREARFEDVTLCRCKDKELAANARYDRARREVFEVVVPNKFEKIQSFLDDFWDFTDDDLVFS